MMVITYRRTKTNLMFNLIIKRIWHLSMYYMYSYVLYKPKNVFDFAY